MASGDWLHHTVELLSQVFDFSRWHIAGTWFIHSGLYICISHAVRYHKCVETLSKINYINLIDVVVVVNLCISAQEIAVNVRFSKPDLLSVAEKLLCWHWQWDVWTFSPRVIGPGRQLSSTSRIFCLRPCSRTSHRCSTMMHLWSHAQPVLLTNYCSNPWSTNIINNKLRYRYIYRY